MPIIAPLLHIFKNVNVIIKVTKFSIFWLLGALASWLKKNDLAWAVAVDCSDAQQFNLTMQFFNKYKHSNNHCKKTTILLQNSTIVFIYIIVNKDLMKNIASLLYTYLHSSLKLTNQKVFQIIFMKVISHFLGKIKYENNFFICM